MALHTRTRTLVASVGAVVVALGLSGCGSADVEDAPVEHKSFAFKGKSLTIDSGNTAVELVPADVDKIEVTRRVDGWVVLGNGPDARWTMRDGKLTLRVKCSAVISNCAALHQVKVPRGVAVTVNGDNGRVVASGFDTPLTLRSDNGRVTVRDSSAPLRLESDNGDIVAERIASKSVSAQSDNGEIRLGFSAVPDLVDTVSDNGQVTIELPKGPQAYAVTAVAGNGDISVRVPRSEDSPHVVKAHSDNGQITVRSAN
ncbi:DUF4097 family beta strand repeat-containing protein [Streptomyces sp. NPDC005181]|uniref:DUF4097 family beta strand repeat-containing protein n=1 Tax=Streptomyces sp. NPDC005181 TaxID=3156869 RepID=UPI0033AD9D2B